MRFAHTSDLHLGKRLSNYDMTEDQRYILDGILDVIVREEVDALLIAGDIYDKSIPSEDAVGLFSYLLTRLNEIGCPVYIAAGNHDSGRRMDFCSDILGSSDIHITGSFSGSTDAFTLEEDGLRVDIHLLPFIRPYTVRVVCGEDVSGLDQAVSVVLDRSDIDPDAVNILVAHQFVKDLSGSELLMGSEEMRPKVGGGDMLASDILDRFDYVALGHIHVPQDVGSDRIRYSGSPLKYSESEADVDKSITIIDVGSKDDIRVRSVPLTPLRGLQVVRGSIMEVLAGGGSEDYTYVMLDDMGENVESRLRKLFPRLCDIRFMNLEKRESVSCMSMDEAREGSIDELFIRFFKEAVNMEMTQSQLEILAEIVSDEGGGME